jgi:hypothetical protein
MLYSIVDLISGHRQPTLARQLARDELRDEFEQRVVELTGTSHS